jgi:hypothetical protein
VFYVGKGSGYRAGRKKRGSKAWDEIATTHGFTYQIIKRYASESEAYAAEIELIAKHKSIGSPLINKSVGGCSGGFGVPSKRHTHTQEAKEKIGRSSKNRSPELLERMTQSQRKIHGKPFRCVETGEIFPSQGAAISWLKRIGHLKASQSGIYKALHKKTPKAYGFSWVFLDAIHTLVDMDTQDWALLDGRTEGKREGLAILALAHPKEYGEFS